MIFWYRHNPCDFNTELRQHKIPAFQIWNSGTWTLLVRKTEGKDDECDMKHSMRFAVVSLFAVGVLLFGSSAFGQSSTTGSIEGVVTDPNGAAVKGATVTVTSPNLITTQMATTGDDGRYQILALPPGAYKVTVDASGFAKYEKNAVAVNLGKTSG